MFKSALQNIWKWIHLMMGGDEASLPVAGRDWVIKVFIDGK